MEKLKNLNDSRPFQQTSMSQQQYSHTHANGRKKERSFLFYSRRILGRKVKNNSKIQTNRIDRGERPEQTEEEEEEEERKNVCDDSNVRKK